ncbi:single-stranded DNA-binding protein [Ruminococcus sp.]|uniref:single-stranded DNA-binding protein n=1 Tax=Ruminococcus sp. TaxID=41978 RepID=UPI0025EA5426|nr:single-stranded DNA-binding protein [Ruminococcus sp.]
MLNRVVLMGRITHDLEIEQTQSGVSVLRFSIAVDRGYAKQGEERQTDFITCVVWRQTAEFIGKYFSKGRMIALEGQLRTGSYEDKNGVKHYTTDVNVDNVSFTGEPKQQGTDSYPDNHSKGSHQQNNRNTAPAADALSIGDLSDFEDVLSDDGIPF